MTTPSAMVTGTMTPDGIGSSQLNDPVISAMTPAAATPCSPHSAPLSSTRHQRFRSTSVIAQPATTKTTAACGPKTISAAIDSGVDRMKSSSGYDSRIHGSVGYRSASRISAISISAPGFVRIVEQARARRRAGTGR